MRGARDGTQVKNMQDKTALKVAAILGLTLIESIALFQGIDGALLTLVVGSIAGLAGYGIGSYRADKR